MDGLGSPGRKDQAEYPGDRAFAALMMSRSMYGMRSIGVGTNGGWKMEAGGIEPPSESGPRKAST